MIHYQQRPNVLYISQSLPDEYSSKGFNKLKYTVSCEISSLDSFTQERKNKKVGSYDCGNLLLYFNKPDPDFEQIINNCVSVDKPYSFMVDTRDKPDLYFTGFGLEVNREYPSGVVSFKIGINSDIYNGVVVNPLYSKRVRDW